MKPKTVSFGRSVWRIVPVDMEDWGLTDFEKQEIRIKSSLSEPSMKDTIFHELCHVAFFYAGIDDEEDTVNRVAPILRVLLESVK